MRSLFFFILAVTYLLVSLIAPQSFDYDEIFRNLTPTAVPTVAVSPYQNNTGMTANPAAGSQNGPVINVQPTEVIVPTATPAEQPFQPQSYAPKDLFGEPQVTDNFERGSSGFGINAGLNDDEAIRIIALNNRISLEPKKNNGWLSWRLRPPAIKDGAAEIDFAISTCARGDRIGLILRASDYSSGHGYYFSLACEGTVSILRDTTVLGTADASVFFKNTSGETNTLTALASGNNLMALLNGEPVLTVEDGTYAEGYSGFFTSPQNQDTLTLDILSFRGYYNQ